MNQDSKNSSVRKMAHDSTLPLRTEAKSEPVAVGTKGTVGSLVMQEMDHFRQLDLSGSINSKKPLMSEFFKPKLGELVITVPRKKKRGSKRLIASMCSVVEVANSSQPRSFSTSSYRHLKNGS